VRRFEEGRRTSGEGFVAQWNARWSGQREEVVISIWAWGWGAENLSRKAKAWRLHGGRKLQLRDQLRKRNHGGGTSGQSVMETRHPRKGKLDNGGQSGEEAI